MDWVEHISFTGSQALIRQQLRELAAQPFFVLFPGKTMSVKCHIPHDHLLKEVAGVRYYYRYADDMVLLAGDKSTLHGWLVLINDWLELSPSAQRGP